MSGRTNFRKILIVDDSHTSRLIIRKAFHKAGYQESDYYEAEDGESAMDIVRQNKVNLVVTDIRMPRMDGEAFIREMRSEPELKDIPVIIVSSSSNIALSETLRNENILGYTLKPVTPEKIINTIEDIYDLVNLEKKLIQALNDTFSSLYDFSASEYNSLYDRDYEPGMLITVEFSRPVNGRLVMMASKDFMKKLKQFMTDNGLADDQNAIVDSFKETINVLCGNFLVQFFGPEKEIKISLPYAIESLMDVADLEIMHEFEVDIDESAMTLYICMEGMGDHTPVEEFF